MVNKNLNSGRIQCHCKDVQNKCGVVINKVESGDEGKWTCLMRLKGNGKTKRKKKSIDVVIEEDYYDEEEYYYEEYPSHNYDQPRHNHDHYHYKTTPTTTTTTTTTTTVLTCPSEWKKYKNHCYGLIKDHNTMQSCREECKGKGGELTSIHSKDENRFLAEFIRQIPYKTVGPVTNKQYADIETYNELFLSRDT